MKRPKEKLRKRIERIKSKAYRKGRNDMHKEDAKLILQLQKEKESQFNLYTKNAESLQNKFRKQLEVIKEDFNQELKNALNEQADLRKKDNEQSEKKIEKVKTMAMQRMKEVREKATEEIEKANLAEQEYKNMYAKTQTLFDKGMAKILRILEDNDSMVTDAAKMRHAANEFFKANDELSALIAGSQPGLTKLKTKELESKSSEIG